MKSKSYYARLPFGQEQRLNLGFGDTCPVCNVKRGQEHEYGCMAEECPLCHRPIVDCYCECLQPGDAMSITLAIEKTFTCMDDAYNAGAGAGKRNADTFTPTDKAAMAYVLKNVPPEVQKKFERGFFDLFPELKPSSISEKGERMYSANDIAEALGMDKDVVNEMAHAMRDEDGVKVIAPLPAGCH